MVSTLLAVTEQNAIREQLDRTLADHLFRNSKRFPDFLRYTVEHALSGDTDDIKERTLGIEVFGRDPSYDTSLDPVVRMTAAEVRKRLAQYYQSPGHENETRIEFPLRSYIPEFRFPATVPVSTPPPAGIQSILAPANLAWNWNPVVALLISCVVLSAFVLVKAAAPRKLARSLLGSRAGFFLSQLFYAFPTWILHTHPVSIHLQLIHSLERSTHFRFGIAGIELLLETRWRSRH